MNYLLLLGGFALLIAAGEVLVRGAAGMALKAKIPPLVVGLTVVSLGTSSPELFASLQAALQGDSEIAVGNVLGSNIANLGLVLGITALIFPIAVDEDLVRRDWPVMMIASALFFGLGFDGTLGWVDGMVFIALLIAFTAYLIVQSRRRRKADVITSNDPGLPREESDEVDDYGTYGSKPYVLLFGLVALGCVGLYYGSEWFVEGAKQIAYDFGISKHVVGVTVVAFGTSVPELAASSVAAFRKQTDISIGNLIGSNIFNIFCVLGVTASAKSLNVGVNVIRFDMLWMIGIAAIMLPLMVTGRRITRGKGAILLAIYVAYIYFLVA